MPPARGLMFALFTADGASSCSDRELISSGGSVMPTIGLSNIDAYQLPMCR